MRTSDQTWSGRGLSKGKVLSLSLAATVLLTLPACSSLRNSATGRNVAIGLGTGAGAATAGAAGFVASGGNPIVTGVAATAGGAAGGVATNMLLGKAKAGVTEEYRRGSSDELKRLYFARNNIEKAKSEGDESGKQVYYTFPARTDGEDGVKYVPHDVTVPVVE